MKAFGKSSIVIWAGAVFLLLALAVYVFRGFPHLLALVLLGELALLAFGGLGPLVRDGFGRGPLVRAGFALLAMALANGFMLLLAGRWGVEPHGWFRAVLHWQDAPLRLVRSALGFLDALLRTLFRLGRTPLSGPLPRLPAGLVADLILGAAASFATARVIGDLQTAAGGKVPARR